MRNFIARHADKISGVLSGFDRILFRGHLSSLCHLDGVRRFLSGQGVLLKETGEFFQATTALIKQAAEAVAERLGRPTQYLQSASVRKENIAQQILEAHPTSSGLVCQLSASEICCVLPVSVQWAFFRAGARQAACDRVRRPAAARLHWAEDEVGRADQR